MRAFSANRAVARGGAAGTRSALMAVMANLRGVFHGLLLAMVCAAPVACSAPVDDPAQSDVGQDDLDHLGLPSEADAGPSSFASVDAAPAPHDAGHVVHPTDAAPPACLLIAPPHKSHLTYGLHPYASDGLRAIGLGAGDISQTIGNAPASAGTHAQDGSFMGYAYSAATDIRIGGLSQAQIGVLLTKLAHEGFAAWYRHPGYDGWPSYDAPHIPAVYVGAPMKSILRAQVHDWIAGRNGLASHTTYKFHTWTKCERDAVWAEFVKHNPAKN